MQKNFFVVYIAYFKYKLNTSACRRISQAICSCFFFTSMFAYLLHLKEWTSLQSYRKYFNAWLCKVSVVLAFFLKQHYPFCLQRSGRGLLTASYLLSCLNFDLYFLTKPVPNVSFFSLLFVFPQDFGPFIKESPCAWNAMNFFSVCNQVLPRNVTEKLCHLIGHIQCIDLFWL